MRVGRKHDESGARLARPAQHTRQEPVDGVPLSSHSLGEGEWGRKANMQRSSGGAPIRRGRAAGGAGTAWRLHVTRECAARRHGLPDHPIGARLERRNDDRVYSKLKRRAKKKNSRRGEERQGRRNDKSAASPTDNAAAANDGRSHAAKVKRA